MTQWNFTAGQTRIAWLLAVRRSFGAEIGAVSMAYGWLGKAAVAAALVLMAGSVQAAPCGNNAGAFESWKSVFASEAQARGVGPKAISALMDTSYSVGTIRADRGQHSFKLSLADFMAKRGAYAIAAKGRGLKAANAALFASIEKRFGVPPGPLITIWGMETGFGSFMGNQPTTSAIATLAYDCRRPDYFTDQLYAALQLIDRGVLSPSQRGSMHGEVGQTQFLPKNIMAYGVGNLESASGALSSTANFLKAHGWRAGAGYQPGEPNFAAIQEWNAAQVYQQAIALMGRQIDGGQ